mmetsp:Transcript_25049/g.20997  ORF Transcript_25049/g.20997 Transcript_25049/m.20997 type:complete len:109 (+) Transcript_25049:247-573(+)
MMCYLTKKRGNYKTWEVKKLCSKGVVLEVEAAVWVMYSTCSWAGEDVNSVNSASAPKTKPKNYRSLSKKYLQAKQRNCQLNVTKYAKVVKEWEEKEQQPVINAKVEAK